jgi:hypothetical protein
MLLPGPRDAIGFRLKVIQELARSAPMHIICKFIVFWLWQETGIPHLHLSSLQTNQQEVPVSKVMLEPKNGICGMEN